MPNSGYSSLRRLEVLLSVAVEAIYLANFPSSACCVTQLMFHELVTPFSKSLEN